MNEIEHLLVCLGEECAEIQQRIAKADRFGLHETQPGQSLDNEQRIIGEIHDLFGVIEMLRSRGILSGVYDSILMGKPAYDAVQAKQVKVSKFMDYARSLGRLTD